MPFLFYHRLHAGSTDCCVGIRWTHQPFDIKYQLQLMELVQKSGCIVVAAIHDLNLSASYCNRLHAIKDGHIVGMEPRKIANVNIPTLALWGRRRDALRTWWHNTTTVILLRQQIKPFFYVWLPVVRIPSYNVASMNETDLPFLFFVFFLMKSLLFSLNLPHHPPPILPPYILIQHPGHHLFSDKHRKRVVLLTVNLLLHYNSTGLYEWTHSYKLSEPSLEAGVFFVQENTLRFEAC